MPPNQRTVSRSTLPIALGYLSKHPDRFIFPLRASAKSPPLVADNLDKATNDADVIRAWHAKWPDANWGLALAKSNLLVVDVDMKPGKNGAATFDDLDLQYGFPATEMVISPSGGHHHYYQGKHVFGLGKHGFGPDVDSPNYVLIPGCRITISGNGSYVAATSPPIQPAPAWFYDVLKAAREHEAVEQTGVADLDTPDNIARAIHYLQNDAKPSIEGRNGESQTLHTAGVLKDIGISEPKAVELMAEHYNVPGTCDPLWLVGEGADADRLDVKVRNAYAYLAGKAPGEDSAVADFADDPPPPLSDVEKHADKGLPKVEVRAGHLTEAMAQVQKHLAAESKKLGNAVHDPIFQRDGQLVRLNRNLLPPAIVQDDRYRENNALTIVPVKAKWLARRLERSMQFVGPSAGNPDKKSKSTKRKLVPKNASAELVASLIEDATNWNLAALFATVEAPTLRADGTILDVPGYDKATGLFFDPGEVVFPKIELKPSKTDGCAAMAKIDALLCDFPFKDDPGYDGVSKSVALAMILTGPVRRTLPIAPAFGIDADEVESGKTLLAQLPAVITTGRPTGVHPFTNDPAEQRKALGTFLIEGRPVLLFDNVDCVIEGDALEMMLTAEQFEDRRLGAHEGFNAPTNVVTIFTGCHLRIGGDSTSRVLMSRVVPSEPFKDRAAKFKYQNLIEHVQAHRPELVCAVLTALRAFILHGRKGGQFQTDLQRTSRFAEWESLIAGALRWYGYQNPVRGGDAIRNDDPVKEGQREFVRAWATCFGDHPVTATEMLADTRICKALVRAGGIKAHDVTQRSMGDYADGLRGVRLGLPYDVERLPTPGRWVSKRWQLRMPDPTE